MQLSRTGPALGGAQHDHRPGGPHRFTAGASLGADLENATDRPIHGSSHGLVHGLRFTAFHEDRLPAVAAHQVRQLVPRNPRQQGGVGDLVAIEVQHRQHRPIADRVEELVDVPRGGQRAGFGLPITDAGQGDQVGVVEDRAAGVGEHVAQFAPLVDRAGGFRGAVAADVPGKGELLEEAAHPNRVLALVGINLAVAAVEVGGSQHPRGTMAGPRQVDHVQVVAADHPVGVGPDEGLTR